MDYDKAQNQNMQLRNLQRVHLGRHNLRGLQLCRGYTPHRVPRHRRRPRHARPSPRRRHRLHRRRVDRAGRRFVGVRTKGWQ